MNITSTDKYIEVRQRVTPSLFGSDSPIKKRIIAPNGSYEFDIYKRLTEFMKATTEDMDFFNRIVEIEVCLLRNSTPVYWLTKEIADMLIASDIRNSDLSLSDINIPLRSGVIMFPRDTYYVNDEPAPFIAFGDYRDHNFEIITITDDERPSYVHSYLPFDATTKSIPCQRHTVYGDEVKLIQSLDCVYFIFKLFLFLQDRPDIINYGTVKKPKKKSYRKRADNEKWLPNVIGKGYGNDVPKVENPTPPQPRGKNRAHPVIGHPHKYRVGEGRKDIKIRWIDPYTRGA